MHRHPPPTWSRYRVVSWRCGGAKRSKGTEAERRGEKRARQGAREPERDSLSSLFFFFFLKGVWCGQRRGEWVKREKKGAEEEEEVRYKATTARFCGRRVG